jgi:hypothetical protein
MKNWVSKLCQKTWHPIQPSPRNDFNPNKDLRINGLASDREDPPSSSEHDRHGSQPLFTPPMVSCLSEERDSTPVVHSGGRRNKYAQFDLLGYLLERENCDQDFHKLNHLLKMPRVLMEIGCGNAEAARQIALKNPDTGVIATDLYDWSYPHLSCSGYGQIAREWRTGQLQAQTNPLDNLVILRAETDLLQCFPIETIDTILLINPEPLVGKSILALLQGELLSQRLKISPVQIVILPYSREMGLMACGGCGFEHDPDWSRGLGFIMGSGLAFKRGASVQWGVDLTRISAYTGNSTQRDIYIYGTVPI